MEKTSRPIWSGILSGLLIAQLAAPAWAQNGKTAPRAAHAGRARQAAERGARAAAAHHPDDADRAAALRHAAAVAAGQGGGTPLPGVAAAPSAAAPSGPSPEATSEKQPEARRVGAAADRRPGAIEGKVAVTGGAAGGRLRLRRERARCRSRTTRSWRSSRRGKQFNPRVAVVQTGTDLVFPNFDAVYHNVFSNSPRNSFDLGTYQAGDKARSVTAHRSGRGRHLLQHPPEDVGQGAGGAERALRQGAGRRDVPDRERPARRRGAWWPGAPTPRPSRRRSP